MTFVKGQRVHVEFDGVIDLPCTNSAYVTSGNTTRWVSHKDITPLDPENWPPQVGDIWEVEGEEYFAQANAIDRSVVVVPIERSSDIGPWWDGESPRGISPVESYIDNFKALGPTLVRRRTR